MVAGSACVQSRWNNCQHCLHGREIWHSRDNAAQDYISFHLQLPTHWWWRGGVLKRIVGVNGEGRWKEMSGQRDAICLKLNKTVNVSNQLECHTRGVCTDNDCSQRYTRLALHIDLCVCVVYLMPHRQTLTQSMKANSKHNTSIWFIKRMHKYIHQFYNDGAHILHPH